MTLEIHLLNEALKATEKALSAPAPKRDQFVTDGTLDCRSWSKPWDVAMRFERPTDDLKNRKYYE